MGRFGWIMAGAAAVVGGWIYHDRASIRWGDHSDGVPVVIDARSDKKDVDPATAKALALAVGSVVRAEARLTKLELIGEASKAELAAARAEVERAEAEVDRLEAEIEARAEQPTDRERLKAEIRDEVRSEVRNEVRDAARSN